MKIIIKGYDLVGTDENPKRILRCIPYYISKDKKYVVVPDIENPSKADILVTVEGIHNMEDLEPCSDCHKTSNTNTGKDYLCLKRKQKR